MSDSARPIDDVIHSVGDTPALDKSPLIGAPTSSESSPPSSSSGAHDASDDLVVSDDTDYMARASLARFCCHHDPHTRKLLICNNDKENLCKVIACLLALYSLGTGMLLGIVFASVVYGPAGT
jgi:hypothetical protein